MLGCVTHQGNLVRLLAGSNPQLVDGRLGDVGSLLGVVQLVLDFPETHRAAGHLLLLVDAERSNSELVLAATLTLLEHSFNEHEARLKLKLQTRDSRRSQLVSCSS